MNEIAYPAFGRNGLQKASLPTFVLLLLPILVSAQTTLTGKVSDITGTPIADASVYFQSSAGTTSNNEGVYTLRTNLKGQQELIVSSVGHKTVTRIVNLAGGTLTVDVQLEQDAVGLN